MEFDAIHRRLQWQRVQIDPEFAKRLCVFRIGHSEVFGRRIAPDRTSLSANLIQLLDELQFVQCFLNAFPNIGRRVAAGEQWLGTPGRHQRVGPLFALAELRHLFQDAIKMPRNLHPPSSELPGSLLVACGPVAHCPADCGSDSSHHHNKRQGKQHANAQRSAVPPYKFLHAITGRRRTRLHRLVV